MNVTTETIDSKIRERARTELRKNIDGLFEPLRDLCAVGSPIATELKNRNGDVLNAATCLTAAFNALVAHHTTKAEQRAVESFLHRFDELEAEFAELREKVA